MFTTLIYATSPIAVSDDNASPTDGVRIKLSTYNTASIFCAITCWPSIAATPGPVAPQGKIPVG